MDTIWDCIVVGAGIQGSFTAYYLAKSGIRTLLIEQFHLPHNRGSSHGATKAIQKMFGEIDRNTFLINSAYTMWGELETEAGVSLMNLVGKLTVKGGNSSTEASVRDLGKYGIHHKLLKGEEKAKYFPMLHFPHDVIYMVESDAGLLHSDKILRILQSLIKQEGGVLHEGEKLSNIEPGDIITLHTSRASYRCRKLVLTVGAWAKPLLSKLNININLKVVKVTVMCWKEKTKGQYDINKFPAFFHENAIGSYSVSGSGSYEYDGLIKLNIHGGLEVDLDSRDSVDQSKFINLMRDYVSKHFPGLYDTPAIVESCLYTMTPDKMFILDHIPDRRNIVIGAGFSGHGFKYSPVIGKLLSEMVQDKPPSIDLRPFRLERVIHRSKL